MTVGAAVAAAERITEQLMVGLSRWFGPYGAQALVTRALTSVRERHPLLSGVSMTAMNRLEGFPGGSGSEHDARATIEAVVATIASLCQLLGRLIGDDLAILLLEQSTSASAIGAPTAPDVTRHDAVQERATP